MFLCGGDSSCLSDIGPVVASSRLTSLLPSHSSPVVMYIYRSMADGISHQTEEELDENMRVIEVEGKPTAVVGIRYKAVDEAPPPIGIIRSASGKLADTGPQSEDIDHQEYWAERPSGLCGGQRLTSTLREDLAASSVLCATGR